jgi:hypothetical protein
MVRLSDDGSLRHQDDLCAFWIDVQRSQNQNETTESCETLNRFEPVVVQIEEKHLRFGSFENPVSKLLNLKDGFVWQLQLRSFDYDIWEV